MRKQCQQQQHEPLRSTAARRVCRPLVLHGAEQTFLWLEKVKFTALAVSKSLEAQHARRVPRPLGTASLGFPSSA